MEKHKDHKTVFGYCQDCGEEMYKTYTEEEVQELILNAKLEALTIGEREGMRKFNRNVNMALDQTLHHHPNYSLNAKEAFSFAKRLLGQMKYDLKREHGETQI